MLKNKFVSWIIHDSCDTRIMLNYSFSVAGHSISAVVWFIKVSEHLAF